MKGLGSQCKLSDKQPAELYFKTLMIIVSVDLFYVFFYEIRGKLSLCNKEMVLDQMGLMRTRFADYKAMLMQRLRFSPPRRA